ncbi:MAG: hypothetical protein E7680_04295 [Ruminococcaceae bacterium]|nr:hypothetical protein [Oscillospiraceae bacterium]
MKKEQTFLLALLSSAFDSGRAVPAPDFSEKEWKAFIAESFYQAVGVLAFSLCEPFMDRVPSDLYSHWNRAIIKTMGRNRNVATAQNELVALLGNRPYLILKGLASAAYYPNSTLRDFGDVDFLVEEKRQTEISELLCSNGYQSEGEGNDHHIVFKKPFCHLELHREPPGIPGGAAGDKIRSFFGKILETAVLQTLDADYLHAVFRAPASEMHGLILLLHMQHHMLEEGLGLRHLLDWGFYVAKTEKEPFWQEALLPLLKEVGLLTFAAAMTKTCAIYLGAPEPEFCRNIPDDLCAGVMEDIFALGNFGMKDRGRSHSAALTENDGNSVRKKSAFRVFHGIVTSKHPILQRAPILYPIFAVGEAFAYGFGALFGKRTRPSKLFRSAKERKTLYNRLAIFQTGNTRSDFPTDSIS